MKRRQCLALACLAAVALPGCAQFYYGAAAGPLWNTNLIDANYRAIDKMLEQATLDPRQPVLVATLVHIDRLTESSRLGRVFSEHIAGRLTQRGVRTTELKLRDKLLMHREQGELMLSREVREVSQTHNAQAVLVGTYAATMATLYVSLKLVHPSGNTVMAAYDYALPMDENVRGLLTSQN